MFCGPSIQPGTILNGQLILKRYMGLRIFFHFWVSLLWLPNFQPLQPLFPISFPLPPLTIYTIILNFCFFPISPSLANNSYYISISSKKLLFLLRNFFLFHLGISRRQKFFVIHHFTFNASQCLEPNNYNIDNNNSGYHSLSTQYQILCKAFYMIPFFHIRKLVNYHSHFIDSKKLIN